MASAAAVLAVCVALLATSAGAVRPCPAVAIAAPPSFLPAWSCLLRSTSIACMACPQLLVSGVTFPVSQLRCALLTLPLPRVSQVQLPKPQKPMTQNDNPFYAAQNSTLSGPSRCA